MPYLPGWHSTRGGAGGGGAHTWGWRKLAGSACLAARAQARTKAAVLPRLLVLLLHGVPRLLVLLLHGVP